MLHKLGTPVRCDRNHLLLEALTQLERVTLLDALSDILSTPLVAKRTKHTPQEALIDGETTLLEVLCR